MPRIDPRRWGRPYRFLYCLTIPVGPMICRPLKNTVSRWSGTAERQKTSMQKALSIRGAVSHPLPHAQSLDRGK